MTRRAPRWSGRSTWTVLALVVWTAIRTSASAADVAAATSTAAEAAFFDEIPSVFAASKYEQKVTDTPSNVTIITAEEIRDFGYRTLADLLASVPGFFVTNDRNYSYAGERGSLRPGDFYSRVLFLIDGHRVDEPVFDSASMGHSVLDLRYVVNLRTLRHMNLELDSQTLQGADRTFE